MSDYSEHLISMAGGDGDRHSEIEARANAATGGPWRARTTGVAGGDHWYICDAGEAVAHVSAQDGINEDQRQPDAEFIANARTDVPYLLALAKDQQNKLDRIIELAHWAGKRGWTIHPAEIRTALDAS